MRIEFVEISNFRKLRAVRIDLTEDKTLFVGANNSGKTSAMVALRHFLVDGGKLGINDFTLSHWHAINAIGSKWEGTGNANAGGKPDLAEWEGLLPSLDLWLRVADDEIHYVSKLLPTLDWKGGLLGIRLRFEPKKIEDLYKEYVTSTNDVRSTKAAAATHIGQEPPIKLWP
ncbi:MAG: AAA family ATPase, partial [Alphaproteobacteria bacterium]|nr:AAA family ATPase [Alphaproteobacteria bacterium]